MKSCRELSSYVHLLHCLYCRYCSPVPASVLNKFNSTVVVKVTLGPRSSSGNGGWFDLTTPCSRLQTAGSPTYVRWEPRWRLSQTCSRGVSRYCRLLCGGFWRSQVSSSEPAVCLPSRQTIFWPRGCWDPQSSLQFQFELQ